MPKQGKQRMNHSSKLPSPKVARKSHWMRSTANSPSVFPKASESDWNKLSTPDQLRALDDVKDTYTHLKTQIMLKTQRSLFPNHEPSMPQAESQAAGSSGSPQTPPQPERKKKKFKPSPSPEGLHGNPHHPARDGMRSSFSLPAFSPAK